MNESKEELPPGCLRRYASWVYKWPRTIVRVSVRESTHAIFYNRITSRLWILLMIWCRSPRARARARPPSGWWLLAATNRITNPASAVALYFKIMYVALEREHLVAMLTSQGTKRPSFKSASLPMKGHARALSKHWLFWWRGLHAPVEQSVSSAIDGFHLKASIAKLGIRYIAWLAYRYHVDRSRLEPGSIT